MPLREERGRGHDRSVKSYPEVGKRKERRAPLVIVGNVTARDDEEKESRLVARKGERRRRKERKDAELRSAEGCLTNEIGFLKKIIIVCLVARVPCEVVSVCGLSVTASSALPQSRDIHAKSLSLSLFFCFL